MDPDLQLLIFAIAFVLWLVAFFAIVRLFSIDKNLRLIANELFLMRSIEERRAIAEGKFVANKCGNCGMHAAPWFIKPCPQCGVTDWREVNNSSAASA